jgi:hypothetical protein
LSAPQLLLLVTRSLRIPLLDHHVPALLNSFGLVHLVLKTLRKSGRTRLETIPGTSLIYLLRQRTDLLVPSSARSLRCRLVICSGGAALQK